MKNLLLVLLFVFGSLLGRSQDSTNVKTKEFHVHGAGFALNSLGVTYGKQVGKRAFLNITSGIINLYMDNTEGIQSMQFDRRTSIASLSFSIGLQKRKILTPKLIWFMGVDLQIGLGIRSYRTINGSVPVGQQADTYSQFTPGIGLPFGLLVDLGKSFYGLVRLTPLTTVKFSVTKYGSPTSYPISETDFKTSFGAQSIRIGFAYKWAKKK